MSSLPIVDVVFQSGVAPFSSEIANSNSIPNPISPLGKKTDSTKRFKCRFSQDLPHAWLYRFQMAPEKNKQKPIDKFQEQVIKNSGTITKPIHSNDYEENLISYTSSLQNNASPYVKHLVKKNSRSLENTHMDSSMPPSFHLKADHRIIKQRMPFLVMHEDPFKKKSHHKSRSNEPETDEVINETPHIKDPNVDKCGTHFYEETVRTSYDQYVEMQEQIVNLKNLQRTKPFLPDHVPKYVRKKAQQSQNFSFSQKVRPLSRSMPIPKRPLTVQAKQDVNKLSSTQNPKDKMINRPFTSLGNGKSMTRKLNIPSINKGTEYSYVNYYDCTRDDDEILERVARHNLIAEEMMEERRREMEKQANSYQKMVQEKIRESQSNKEKPVLEDNQTFKRKIVNLMMNNETDKIEEIISARAASARAAQESEDAQFEEEEDEDDTGIENQTKINTKSRIQNILLD